MQLFVTLDSVGAALIILRSWKAKSGPVVVGYMLTYTVSGILSAWIIKMMAESFTGQSMETYHHSYINQNTSEYIHIPEQNLSLNGTSINAKDAAYNVILNSYVLNGCLQIFAGVLCILVAICVTKKLKTIGTCTKQSKVQGAQDKNNLSVINKFCVLLFTMLTTFQLMLEIGYAGLLINFIVDHLKWTKSEAMVMSSVLFLSNTVGKMCAIPLTKFIAPEKLLGATLIVNTIMTIMLSGLVDVHASIIWICTVLSGSMSAIQLPTIFTWASVTVPITGKVASVVAGLPYAISLMLGILAVGSVMNEFGPIFYSYSMAVYVIITNILFGLTWYFAKLSKRQKAVAETNKNHVR